MRYSTPYVAPAMAGLMLASFCTAPVMAFEDNRDSWYLGASGDATWMRHSDLGGGGNINLGYQLGLENNDDLRLEAQVGYHAAEGEDGFNTTHYYTALGNVYYDFNNMFSSYSSGWDVNPYIGVGAGTAAVHYGRSNLSNTLQNNENVFAWQGMAGLSLVSSAMPNTDWVVGYRYLGTGEDNLHANNIEFGVRFHF